MAKATSVTCKNRNCKSDSEGCAAIPNSEDFSAAAVGVAATAISVAVTEY
jgi:hypothetical protein